MMAPSTPEIRVSNSAALLFRAAADLRLAPKCAGGRVFFLISINPFAAPAAIVSPGARKAYPSMKNLPPGSALTDTFDDQAHEAETPRRALFLDTELYQSYLDSAAYTDAEKHALVQTVWNIIVAVINLDMKVHPWNAPEKICGKLDPAADEASQIPGKPLESDNTDNSGGAQ